MATRHVRAVLVTLGAACGLPSVSGCASGGGSPRTGSTPYALRTLDTRDRFRAEELCDEAELHMEGDPDRAEQLLQEALTLDVYNGRAHNNLGVMCLSRGDLYAAAGEFEAARALLPDNPDPRINLGLVFERAGQIDRALTAYAAAHELNPSHLGAIQAFARAQLRHGREDARTAELLNQVALRGDATWRQWALAHIAADKR